VQPTEVILDAIAGAGGSHGVHVVPKDLLHARIPGDLELELYLLMPWSSFLSRYRLPLLRSTDTSAGASHGSDENSRELSEARYVERG
jgi:hypothetical protein